MREREIFIAALEREDLTERAALLDEACQADVELRKRVERLLQEHERQESFILDAPLVGFDATVDQPIHEQAGAVIGPFKLLEQIGEGGFGVVFMAEQERPVRRRVALKVIKAGMDTRQVIARFEAERQALALMDHPNIAKVLEAGATNSGRPYFVMELVRGVPITEFCDANELSPRDRLALFVQVCRAVQHAHNKGIIHRDIKPTNVLVTLNDGVPVPKVIDFGVAKATGHQLTERTLFTHFAQMVGTPLYMSPEQAEMTSVDVDTRSDVYSLGVLLYELLTGTTPLDKERLKKSPVDELRRIIREEEPLPPSTKLSTMGAHARIASARGKCDIQQLSQFIRGDLDWIVMKALEKERSRRYDTASGFARDIERYLSDEPVEARPPSARYRVQKFVRRHRGPVLAGTMVMLTMVVGIIGTTWGMLRATRASAALANEAKQKEAALNTAQQNARNAQNQLFAALLSQARARRYGRQQGQRLDSLAALAQAAKIRRDERLRDEAIAAMTLPDLRRLPVWRAAPPGTTAMTYSGLCRFYASVDAQGIMSIRRISDDFEIQRVDVGTLVYQNYIDFSIDFSPDEKFVTAAKLNQRTLQVWRVADGQEMLRNESCNGALAYDFAPDGERLAVGQEQSVAYFDLSTGEEILRWNLPAPAYSLDFNLKGDRLAVGYDNSNVVSVFNAATGELVVELPVGGMNGQIVAWHPHGEFLATSAASGHITLWSVSLKRRQATLEGHKPKITKLIFHPTGDYLVSHSWDHTLRVWDPFTGRQLCQLVAAGDRPYMSRDGQWIWAGLHGESALLAELVTCPEYRTLVSRSGRGSERYKDADISPDGRLLVVGLEQGAGLWDLDSGRELARLPRGTIHVFFDRSEYNDSQHLSDADSADSSQPSESSTLSSRPYVVLAGGPNGLARWPISEDRYGARLKLGPPKMLSDLTRAWFERSLDGSAIGVATQWSGPNRILDLKTGTVLREFQRPHPNGEIRAVSSDGRWAASCGWGSEHVRLWNARTGEMVHEWSFGKQTLVQFTPDGRNLIILREPEFSFWNLETLQPVRRLRREFGLHPCRVGFSRDGALMALEMAPGEIHLVDAATFRTVARLADPHGDHSVWLDFTPDGTKLVAVTNFATAIHIWDLRAIRARLKEINLDWDWPEFPPAEQTAGSQPDVHMAEVVLADRAQD